MMTVYLITNKINNKAYIGITTSSIEERFRQHLCMSEKRRTALQHAIHKYGKENFTIIPVWSGVVLPQELYFLEKYYIKSYGTKAPNGYNLTDGGDGVINPSEETRNKMSKAKLGVEPWNKGVKGLEPWNKGKKGVQEAWNKGVKMPGGMKEARAAAALLGPWNKGKKGTQESWNKGKGMSPEEKKIKHREANAKYEMKKKIKKLLEG